MKRVVSVFFCLIFSLSALMLRLYSLSTSGVVRSAGTGSTLTVEVASGRGFLYDRIGLPFVNTRAQTVAAAAPLAQTMQVLREACTPEDFSEARFRLEKGLPAVVPLLRDAAGEGIFTVRRPIRYAEPFLIEHLAGYCDSTGHGVCGLEKSFDALLGTRSCTVTYDVDATGRVLCGGNTRLSDGGLWSPRGVQLTREKRLQAAVREAMLSSRIRKGAAVLLDAQTSDILAMVSLPEWDAAHPENSLRDKDSPFLNRALNPVSVGSVYKIIVAAAALENGVPETFRYTCTGETVQDGVTFHCHLHAGHGAQNMAQAMANSCNPWFIHAARQIPIDAILDLSWRLGLGSSVTLADDIVCGAGVLPDSAELQSDAARANIAFGQGRLTAAPLQIAAATAACVNGGIYHEPRLICALYDDQGRRTQTELSAGERVLRSDTSDTVRELLVYAAAQTERLTFKDCGGKTATAQSGFYRDGVEQLNTWYSGFFPARQPQYVLTVFCEDGDSGASDCLPVFGKIAQEICKNP